MKAILSVGKIAALELLHERVFYLFLGLVVASLVVSAALGQLTYTEQTKLTLDFLLAGTEITALLFAVFMSIGLFQRELNQGSVAMVLSKPLPRWSFLVGKFMGQMTIQWLVVTGMAIVTLLLIGGDPTLSKTSMAQAFFSIALESSILASFAYLCAVHAGPIVSAAACGAAFFVGNLHFESAAGPGNLWKWIRRALPELDAYNLKAMAVYGVTLQANEVGWLIAYCLVASATFLALAAWSFERRDILT